MCCYGHKFKNISIMRIKSFLYVSMALLACAAMSCKKDEPKIEEYLKVEPTSITVAPAATTRTLSVSTASSWTATSSDTWFTFSPASGNGDGQITVSITENAGEAGQEAPARNGSITVTAGGKNVKISVSQNKEAVVFAVVGDTAAIPAGGGKLNVKVTHNVSYQVSIPSDASWITQALTKAPVTDDLVFNVDVNMEDKDRSARIAFTPSGGEAQYVTVTQGAGDVKYFAAGTGTEADPYQISSEQELVYLSSLTNGGKAKDYAGAHYIQTADIMITAKSFNPIAQNSTFTGSYNGNGKCISGLYIANTEKKPAGFIATASGARLSGLTLKDVNIDSQYIYCGAFIGKAENGTVVENCTISGGQVRQYTSGITAPGVAKSAEGGVANAGISGGIVGYNNASTVRNCTVDANVTFYGKFCGGVVGLCNDGTIENCKFLKERSCNIYYHFCGGIVGRVWGGNSVVKGCSFEGNLTTVGYCCGGIVGEMTGGSIENCVCGSYAYIGADKYYVGGIAGATLPVAAISIRNCASYGTLRGSYAVAGITGYIGGGTGSDTALALGANGTASVSGCACVGATVTATGGNGNGYPIAAGIVGWCHSPGKVTISSCYSIPGVVQTTYGAHVNGVLSGMSSYSNGAGGATFENCYSAFTPQDLLICNDPVSSLSSSLWYAAIHIRCTGATAVKNCYSEQSLRIGYSSSAATETGCEQFTAAQMTDGTLLGKLNATAVNGVVWVAGSNGYPAIQGIPADPTPKPKAKKRISVIGDSISTFKGWIPAGYSAHYPATDGTLTLVDETYWYRLVKDYMKDAEFDTNIAFSGSTVTNTTEANYRARYGTADNAWWHNDFPTRFAACGGCGHPDIILIHGGTNDWAHNADPLAPGVAIRNDASNIYGGSAPSEGIMNAIYAKADACTSRAQINALPDGTYCEAYVKLMAQIRERYPKCKVVCIIGDYLNQAVEQSTIQIANRYGAKTVNLFRVNGFNDLGGYSPSTLKNKGTQPNMPKHDYSGDLSGCHPGSAAMKFIAEKIYAELGPWLEAD